MTAYIDSDYYTQVFKGRDIPASDFDRLASAASELIYSACRIKPKDETTALADFKTAVAYQTEMLYEQGGIDALVGFSAASAVGGSESLGEYSVSAGNAQSGVATAQGGVPLSPMALAILKRLGLMSRWAYSGFFEDWR